MACSVWNLVLIKIQSPYLTPLAPREMLPGGFGDFYFLWSYWPWARAAFDEVMGGGNDCKWICRASGGHCWHVYSARSTKLAQLLLSRHFLFTPCSGLHITKVLWNQRPLRHPAANRVHLHKGVNGTTWRLGLEYCYNKDSTPLPNSVGTKRNASFIFVCK